jgi:hypothetical protein
MGGLVVANALSMNHKDAAKQAIADRTIGALFLGTPFLGSSKARYAKVAATLMSIILPTQRANVKDLEEKSKKLIDICEAFAKYLRGRDRSRELAHLELACFFEERKMSRAIGFVVEKQSATWQGVDALSIPANHVNIARFQDNDGSDYKMVVGKLKEWVGSIEKNKTNGEMGGAKAQVSPIIDVSTRLTTRNTRLLST